MSIKNGLLVDKEELMFIMNGFVFDIFHWGWCCFRCPHLSFMNGNISSLGLAERGGETFSPGSLMVSKAAGHVGSSEARGYGRENR